jgi:hypothetical protein
MFNSAPFKKSLKNLDVSAPVTIPKVRSLAFRTACLKTRDKAAFVVIDRFQIEPQRA